MDRHFVFKHYWWIALMLGGAGIFVAVAYGGDGRIGFVGSVVASALAFCYFVQQQKLAETTLFHQLFTAFNSRYDNLNDKLAFILEGQGPLSAEQRSTIVDYFNLCAEEYLFFQKGYIPRTVWRSWCRGMVWYLKRHPFKDVWNEEFQSDSYYGLSLDVIRTGAG